MARTLSGFTHPGAVRDSEWDLRSAGAVLEEKNPSLREAVGSSLDRVAAVGSRLPVQVIHGDISDSNVLLTPTDEVAVIDFGDVGVSWRCGELAVAAACVLGKTPDDVAAVLALVESFVSRVALTDDELSAVWPLIVVRTAVLLATGDDDEGEPNAYTRDREAFEQAAFAAAIVARRRRDVQADRSGWASMTPRLRSPGEQARSAHAPLVPPTASPRRNVLACPRPESNSRPFA